MIHDLLSLDVWDTLIRRKIHPEAVKLSVANFVILNWPDLFGAGGVDLHEFYQSRLKTEALLAKAAEDRGFDGEYVIHHVIARWIADALPGAAIDELEHIVGQTIDYEIAFETKVTYADPGIRDFLIPYRSKQVVFLSDFYMPAEFLRRILRANGLEDIVTEGLVSCDYLLNKRSGRLFERSHQQYGISIAKLHLHIGDNPLSDVKSPANLGIKAILYQPAGEFKLKCDREAAFQSRRGLFNWFLTEASSASIDLHESDNETMETGLLAAAWALVMIECACLKGSSSRCEEGSELSSMLPLVIPTRFCGIELSVIESSYVRRGNSVSAPKPASYPSVLESLAPELGTRLAGSAQTRKSDITKLAAYFLDLMEMYSVRKEDVELYMTQRAASPPAKPGRFWRLFSFAS